MNQDNQQESPLTKSSLDIIFKEGVISIEVKEGETYSLYRQDYESLLGQNWLRTQALDLLLKLLFHKYSSEIRKTYASKGELNEEKHTKYIKVLDAFVATLIMVNCDKQILQSLAPLQLFSPQNKYFLLPINTDFKQGQHWLLAVFKNGNYLQSESESCLYIFDSGWGGSQIGKLVKKQLQFFCEVITGKKLNINLYFGDAPKQSNSYDCGIFTVGFTEYLLNQIVEQLQENQPLRIDRLGGKYKYLLANSKMARQRYRQMLESKLTAYLQ